MPAFETAVLFGAVDPFFDIANGFEVFVQFLAVGRRNAALEIFCIIHDVIENAAVTATSFWIAHEQVENARGIDFLHRWLRLGSPGNAGAVQHREAIFEAHLGRFNAEHKARELVCAHQGAGP
jgi:hypothetical protein